MRIGLLIGGLGQGGAERQLAQLALGLRQRGHEVEVMTYTAAGPWGEELQQRGVPVHSPGAGSKWAKWAVVRDWLRTFRPDVVHGSMKRASSLAVLANLPERRCRVVGTDMSTASYSRHKPDLWAALLLYAFTDAVVTQTEMNRRNLARLAPWLARRLHVIRNGVDTGRFRPAERSGDEDCGAAVPAAEVGVQPSHLRARSGEDAGTPGSASGDAFPATSAGGHAFRFVCVGTVYRVKNPVRVVEAVHELTRRGHRDFCLDWYGRPGLNANGSPSEECQRAGALVSTLGLEERVRFVGPCRDIERVYPQADALVHASLQEGIPNAVVEGLACGLPVVVSRVSDLPLMVQEARNGFVCDATRPESIADAMEAMLRTPPAERAAMGRRSRELAVRWFGMDRFVGDFEALYRSLLARP